MRGEAGQAELPAQGQLYPETPCGTALQNPTTMSLALYEQVFLGKPYEKDELVTVGLGNQPRVLEKLATWQGPLDYFNELGCRAVVALLSHVNWGCMIH